MINISTLIIYLDADYVLMLLVEWLIRMVALSGHSGECFAGRALNCRAWQFATVRDGEGRA
jgi:hypothetical protein